MSDSGNVADGMVLLCVTSERHYQVDTTADMF
jgi:hypothetical protein